MAKVECDRSGWSLYRDPETGEDIPLDGRDIPDDVAKRLAEASHHIHIVELSEDSKSDDGNNTQVGVTVEGDEDTVESVSAEFHCGVNGCSRTVDSPEDTCWQHEDE